MTSLLLLASVPVLIATNAFFVAGEYALVAARPVHLESLRKRGRSAAANAMERLKADTASAIGTIQVCITATNLALGAFGEPAMTALLTRLLGPLAAALPDAAFRATSLGLSFLAVTLLTVVFSELLPKAMSLRYVEAAATLTAVPVRFVSSIVWPLVWLMNKMANLVTRPLGLGRVEEMEEGAVSLDELRIIASEAERGGVLTAREKSLIVNTLSMNTRIARQIMVPRVQVTFLDMQRSMEENRRIMNERLYTRLPLCDGGLDNVIGVVHTKRFLAAYNAEADVSVLQLIADEATFVPEHATVGTLVSTFGEKRTEFAVLVDEYGGVAGIVTLKDVVDELMGVVDETKALVAEAKRSDVKTADAAGRVVRGDLPAHELARLLSLPEWAAEFDAATVGGVLQEELGRLPASGEEAVVEGVRLRVLKSDGRSVRRVHVHIVGSAAATTAG